MSLPRAELSVDGTKIDKNDHPGPRAPSMRNVLVNLFFFFLSCLLLVGWSFSLNPKII